MSNIKYKGFCTDCGFQIKSFDENFKTCPNCNSSSVPCGYEDQVDVNINWHELRILCIWAEQWGHQQQELENGICTTNGAGTVYSIAQRIQNQHPDKKQPLTLASGIQHLKETLQTKDPSVKIITNIKGIETNKDGEIT